MSRAIAIRGLWAIILAGCVFSLSSCGTGGRQSPARSRLEVPLSWQQAEPDPRPLESKSLSTWWTRFNDPVLEELIANAVRFSPDVHSALSRIAEYRARRGSERSALFPSVDAQVSGGRSRDTNRANNVTTAYDAYSASLDASWQVDLFGRQRLMLAAASADLARIEEDYHGSLVSLAADVALAYVDLRSAEAQLSVVQRSLGTRRETAELTEWREQAGTGDALDTQRSLAAFELARAAIPALQLTITQTQNQLAWLSGAIPGSLDRLLATPGDVPRGPPDLALGIPAEMLRQRPDMQAAERGLQAAFARTSAARRARLPALNLGGSIGVEALTAGRLFNPASHLLSIFGSITAPIFNAGRINQTITIQRELEQQSLNTYDAIVLVALVEVENALVAVQRNGERLGFLSLATTAAKEAATLAALQFQSGQVDLLVSLDAQRSLLELEQQVVTTTANRAIAYVQLYQALGGGWTAH